MPHPQIRKKSSLKTHWTIIFFFLNLRKIEFYSTPLKMSVTYTTSTESKFHIDVKYKGKGVVELGIKQESTLYLFLFFYLALILATKDFFYQVIISNTILSLIKLRPLPSPIDKV